MVDFGPRALAALLMDRVQWLRGAGLSYSGKRDLTKILGYDDVITVRQYLDEYARGGISKRLVECLPKATWRGGAQVLEDEDPKTKTPFEQVFEDLEKRLKLRASLERVDILSGLSTYAVLLIGAPGKVDTELPKGKGDGTDLLYFTPFLGSGGTSGQRTGGGSVAEADASIIKFEEDPANKRFGLPVLYQLRRIDVNSELNLTPVHWTRVLHVADGCLQDDVYGVPTLESVWNLLMDLHKVTGGGAEAFWLRADQGMHIDIDKDMQLKDVAAEKESLAKQAEDYKHQLTRWIRTRGVNIEPLGSDVADFMNPADAIITQIAGSKGIPKRILTGSEMGELASSQDRENFKDLVVGRQETYAAPYIVRTLVDRLIEFGYVPTPKAGPDKYLVKWQRQQALMERERSAGARAWSQVNASAGTPVFTTSEIRDKWADLPPLTDEQKAEIQAESDAKVKAAQQAMMKPGEAPGEDESEDLQDPDEVKEKRAEKKAEGKTPEEDAEDVTALAAALIREDQTEVLRILGVGADAGL